MRYDPRTHTKHHEPHFVLVWFRVDSCHFVDRLVPENVAQKTKTCITKNTENAQSVARTIRYYGTSPLVIGIFAVRISSTLKRIRLLRNLMRASRWRLGSMANLFLGILASPP